MKTESQLKKEVEAIFEDYKISSTSYHNKQIDYNKSHNLQYEIEADVNALGVAGDLVASIISNSHIITSALAHYLKTRKSAGCLTDNTIDKSFQFIADCIDFVGAGQQYSQLWGRHDAKHEFITEMEDKFTTLDWLDK